MQSRPLRFSNKDRKASLEEARKTTYDLTIIGGGITGAGIALDASLRGLKVLLIEKNDFASGTSSKSTKLIHGGLRYLKQLEFGLVRESGLERAIAHDNICHLVHPENMLLPIVDQGTFNLFTASLAITVYDRLAKVQSDQRRKNLSKQEMLNLEPLLKERMIKSGILYSEYRTDDARLTLEVIKAAQRNGAQCFNHMELTDFVYTKNKIKGIKCQDDITKEKIELKTKLVVSAAGPWVDSVNTIDDKNSESNLHLTKGVHIVFDKENFPLNNSVYFDAFDGRLLFAIPRNNVVYAGTTDTTYSDDLDDIRCTSKDVDYVLKAVKNYFDLPNLGIKDVKSTWAGIRPLIKQKGKGPTEISRKDEIFISESGLITIAGGKLTGFRKMAERVVDLVGSKLKKKKMTCLTENYSIHHNPFKNYTEFVEYKKLKSTTVDLPDSILDRLVSNYGKDADLILDNSANEQELLINELNYCLDHELVYHPLDFIDRRTGWLYFDIDRAREFAELIILHIAEYYSLDQNMINTMTQEVKDQIDIHSLQQLKLADVNTP